MNKRFLWKILPFLFLVVLIFFQFWDGTSNSFMSSDERALINRQLLELDQLLSEKLPSVKEKFLPVETDRDFKVLTDALGGKRVEVLEAWYTWQDGTNVGASSIGRTLDYPLSMADAIKYRNKRKGSFFLSRKKRFSFVLAFTDINDGYFLDISTSQPYVFRVFAGDIQYLGSPSQFLGHIIDLIKQDAFFISEEDGYLDINFEKWDSLEEEYLSTLHE